MTNDTHMMTSGWFLLQTVRCYINIPKDALGLKPLPKLKMTTWQSTALVAFTVIIIQYITVTSVGTVRNCKTEQEKDTNNSKNAQT